MAGDAPSHFKGTDALHFKHPLYRSVAGGAGLFRLDVSLMSEMNKVGQVVQPLPTHRFAATFITQQLFDFRPVGGDGPVAGQTYGQSRYPGARFLFHSAMAEVAGEIQFVGMSGMGKSYGLCCRGCEKTTHKARRQGCQHKQGEIGEYSQAEKFS
jgi:hypothetical protein